MFCLYYLSTSAVLDSGCCCRCCRRCLFMCRSWLWPLTPAKQLKHQWARIHDTKGQIGGGVPNTQCFYLSLLPTLLSDSQVLISVVTHSLWRTVSGQVKAHVVLTCTWGLTQSPSCDCGQRQTMSYIVDTCPLTKFEDGLNLLQKWMMMQSHGWTLQQLQHSWNNNCDTAISTPLLCVFIWLHYLVTLHSKSFSEKKLQCKTNNLMR